ncbi:PHB depolymerase family esterase [Streptomyces sp. NPDC047108]|uniref:extracellular catalytic domain type 1 short-chain-length polyhydroxyalkanoate depolymerase n=1 Tax=Streptomyces sp. NPDC047108 TaxID=3155025 RepID=UPI0033CF93D6
MAATDTPQPARPGPPFATRGPRRLRRTAPFAAALLAALLALPQPASASASAASLTEVTGFGSNPGQLRMFRYVPDGLPSGRPLVVALHGCTQSAAAYDDETGWTRWADEWGFALLLPQQQSGNNLNGCFNWFQPQDTGRGSGEALSIRQMVDRMRADLGTDASRVHVTGLSAGGAMTSAMAASYPDVFAGAAVVAGLPYDCARTIAEALTCMNPGRDLAPQAWGDKVRAAFPSYAGPRPTVSVWHGAEDITVRPVNRTEIVEQWTDAHGTDAVADASDTVQGHRHEVFTDGSGRPVVESYALTGMGHGQPVDPGSGAEQCGVAGPYVLDANLCASHRIGRSWGLDS